MSSLVLDRPRPAPSSAPVVVRPHSATALTLAAARADVVRLEFSAAWPDVAALRRAVDLLHEELAGLGRPRSQVRVELVVEVLTVEDAQVAAATRTRFGMLDALVGVAPHVGRGSLVGTAVQLRTQVQRLARQVGADAVVTVPLTGA